MHLNDDRRSGDTVLISPRRPGTVTTWIDRTHAVVARAGDAVDAFELPADEAGRTAALANVVRAIGDAERVLIVGDEPERTRLEREYVTVWQRPDRLVDVRPLAAGPSDTGKLAG